MGCLTKDTRNDQVTMGYVDLFLFSALLGISWRNYAVEVRVLVLPNIIRSA